MNDVVLRVAGLSKRFRRPSRAANTLLVDELAGLFDRLRGRRAVEDEFWALRDVGLEVRRGEVVGLIGHNGAGKSTLLKLLCRILHPTTGCIEIQGRVGSLLEVGTGFHPELTGRENIYLNGAILGMTRREIARNFDAIVAFAEVERFLNVPVKHYSSGMAVRLAFAVAAHLEPELLLVDEVLAVGDVAFQRKCLGRLRDLSAQAGRTVVLVSHNPAALASLCQRGVVLDHGRVLFDGAIRDALQRYTGTVDARVGTEWQGRAGDDRLRLVRAWVRPLGEDNQWDTGNAIEVGGTVEIRQPVEGLIFGFRLLSEYGADLAYTLFDDLETGLAEPMPPCRLTHTWKIPANTLAAGRYRVAFELALAFRELIHREPLGELAFDVENLTGIGRRYPVQGVRGFNSLLRPPWPAEKRVEPLSS